MQAADILGLGIGSVVMILIIACWAILMLFFLFLFVLWIITIIDCAKRKDEEFPDGGKDPKIIWLVILTASWLVSLNWVAAIVYYFVVMRKKPLKR